MVNQLQHLRLFQNTKLKVSDAMSIKAIKNILDNFEIDLQILIDNPISPKCFLEVNCDVRSLPTDHSIKQVA